MKGRTGELEKKKKERKKGRREKKKEERKREEKGRKKESRWLVWPVVRGGWVTHDSL